MAITARLRPVFCVFEPKIPRTFYFKLTEQSSRKKLAEGGFEPEKVRLLYPAPNKDNRTVSSKWEMRSDFSFCTESWMRTHKNPP